MPIEKIKKLYSEFAILSSEESSKNEIRAVKAERQAEDCYVAEYMKAHLGEEFTGIISGMTAKGIFVKIENGAEGFVSLTDFVSCDFEYDGSVQMKDRNSERTIMIGDQMDIIVAASDVSSGRVDFMPVNA